MTDELVSIAEKRVKPAGPNRQANQGGKSVCVDTIAPTVLLLSTTTPTGNSTTPNLPVLRHPTPKVPDQNESLIQTSVCVEARTNHVIV